MDLYEAIAVRHSVRSFTERRIEGETLAKLEAEIENCRQKSGLNFSLVRDEPKAFDSFLAHYGKFKNANNYIAIFAKESPDAEEKAGYYGERIVLAAQTLGLNTCWVALTFKKRLLRKIAAADERLVLVIAIGYGSTQGVAHRSRPIIDLYESETTPIPQWFFDGVEAARLAPTAMNQQKFRFTLTRDGVRARTERGTCAQIDLGIAKMHFELGAGEENFRWVK